MNNVVGLLLCASLVACSSPIPKREPAFEDPPAPTATPDPIATGTASSSATPTPTSTAMPDTPKTAKTDVDLSNDFAVKLFVPLATEKQENVTISGTSVRLALGLVAAGAKGTTASEMVTALSLHADGAGPKAKAELAEWKTRNTKGITIKIANRLFTDKAFKPVDSFLKVATGEFDAGLESVDFRNSPEPSRKTINDWVKKATENKIPELLPNGSVNPDTRLVVTNAVYFLGTWMKPFDPKLTTNDAFFVRGTTSTKVPTMHRTGRMNYGEVDDVALAELPYGDGKMGMVIVLPKDKAGLPKVLGAMRGETIAKWQKALEMSQELDMALPKFELTWGKSIKGPLSKLGMNLVFSEAADLSGISATGKMLVTDVFHKTYVRVDEKGTEAAAATGVVVGVTSLPPPPKPFVVDHPFVYYLVDKTNGRVLFIGSVVDPTAKL
jgi:serpin B